MYDVIKSEGLCSRATTANGIIKRQMAHYRMRSDFVILGEFALQNIVKRLVALEEEGRLRTNIVKTESQ